MGPRPKCRGRHVRLVQDRGGQAGVLVQQRKQEMLHIHLLVAVADGERLGLAERVLEFFGEAVEIHIKNLSVLLSTNLSITP